MAVSTRNPEVVEVLLESNKFDPNELGRLQKSALGIAAEQGIWEVVEVLLGQSKVNLDVSVGEVVKFLLRQSKVNVNIKNSNGDTPLLAAVKGNHASVARALLQHRDVDPFIKDNDGKTALDVAIEKNYDLIKSILERDPRVIRYLATQNRAKGAETQPQPAYFGRPSPSNTQIATNTQSLRRG